MNDDFRMAAFRDKFGTQVFVSTREVNVERDTVRWRQWVMSAVRLANGRYALLVSAPGQRHVNFEELR